MIWVAYLDEVPTLSTTNHEVCEPEPLTEEEIVRMWDGLKQRYMEIKEGGIHMTRT